MTATVISCATSDLVTDQRLHRMAGAMMEMGYRVEVIGRKRKSSGEVGQRNYSYRRLTTVFEKGPLFYMDYNIRLFFRLLFSRATIILSNDLDTLPACAMASILRSEKLIYDSHEYFTEVPELRGRPVTRGIWKLLEWIFIRRASLAMTVSESIAAEYAKKYGMNFRVVRNLPEAYDAEKVRESSKVDLSRNGKYKVIIYQGSVNVGRGLEDMIQAMEFLPDCLFCIFGDGDILQNLKTTTAGLSWKGRIFFMGRIALEQLPAYTVKADIGISLEKDAGLSYRYSLPNKVFDCIQARVPLVISALPEMMSLNGQFNVGVIASDLSPQKLAATIQSLLNDKNAYRRLKQNAKIAAGELNWTKEKEVLRKAFSVIPGLLK